MKQYQSSSELKNMAKEKLAGKYGSAMLVSPILNFVITFFMLFSLIMLLTVPLAMMEAMGNSFMNESVITLITVGISLICSIFTAIFNTGISLFFLNIACGKHHSMSDLFWGFRWQFQKSLTIATIMVLLNTLCMLPYELCVYFQETDYWYQWTVSMVIFYLLGTAIYIPISLALSQVYYLLLDFPQYSVRELLQHSIRIMKGHKKRLFYLQLSFIPLQILCILSFYIGFLWLIPYQNMTYTLFYLNLMKPKQQTGTQYDQYA